MMTNWWSKKKAQPWAFRLINEDDKVKVVIGIKSIDILDIYQVLFNHVIEEVYKQSGVKVNSAIVTVPSYYNEK